MGARREDRSINYIDQQIPTRVRRSGRVRGGGMRAMDGSGVKKKYQFQRA